MGLRTVSALLAILALCASSYAQNCNIQDNQDIELPDLAVHHGQWVDNCCNICVNTPGCRGFAWNDYLGGTCWLKAGAGPLVWKANVKAGVAPGGGGNLVEFGEFQNAVTANGYPAPSQTQYNSFMAGLPKGHISSKQEAAMALTHFMHESDGLRAKREYACLETGCPGHYETPGCDAGGQRYFGRGYIQLSWCYNYRPASEYLFGDHRLVWDSDMVAREEQIAWDTAYWFWMANVHSRPGVAEGMFGVTTRAINGGLECDGAFQHIARHRFQMYLKVRQAFGLSGNADERGCYN